MNCKFCQKELVRRANEQKCEFEYRTFCSQKCSQLGRVGKPKDLRTAFMRREREGHYFFHPILESFLRTRT